MIRLQVHAVDQKRGLGLDLAVFQRPSSRLPIRLRRDGIFGPSHPAVEPHLEIALLLLEERQLTMRRPAREAPPPPNPPPVKGRAARRDAALDSVNNHSQPGAAEDLSISSSPGHDASCLLGRLFIRRQRPSSLMGEGLGGGDAAQLAGDRLMHAVGICQDLVVPKPQNAIALVLQEPASLGLLRRRAIGHVRRRRDASSCLDLRGEEHHPLPTLPHRGGGL
jgi:hypothetical protein